ncbi:MAG: rRNA cytosine-C5-methyltransferase, partial [Bacteroidaceae bacterium]|nr:rRNA cytosine-C5-methyltransferase [Bacteroidaceae bacterium]
MNLPYDFQQTMIEHLGKEAYEQLAEALSLPAPTSIRLNRSKIKAEELPLLTEADSVPWCAEGFYLKERPQFTFDPLFHAGCYYVQEASSMFLSHVLKHYVQEPVVALDLCAAPGGKST